MGYTFMLPDGPLTPTRLLTPLSIVMEVAPLVIQVRVTGLPEVTLDEEAISAAIGAEPVDGGVYELPTVIVVLALLLPAEFVAVR